MTAWCQLFLKMLFFFKKISVVILMKWLIWRPALFEEYTVFCGSERLNNLFMFTELISREAEIPKQSI